MFQAIINDFMVLQGGMTMILKPRYVKLHLTFTRKIFCKLLSYFNSFIRTNSDIFFMTFKLIILLMVDNLKNMFNNIF